MSKSIKVRGFLQDVGGASRVTKLRAENFAKGSPIPDPRDPIRELADQLHPKHMLFKVVDIREASPSSRVFRFESADGHIPVFQSGRTSISTTSERISSTFRVITPNCLRIRICLSNEEKST